MIERELRTWPQTTIADSKCSVAFALMLTLRSNNQSPPRLYVLFDIPGNLIPDILSTQTISSTLKLSQKTTRMIIKHYTVDDKRLHG